MMADGTFFNFSPIERVQCKLPPPRLNNEANAEISKTAVGRMVTQGWLQK